MSGLLPIFFISKSFPGCRQPGADDSDSVSSFGVENDQEPVSVGEADQNETLLVLASKQEVNLSPADFALNLISY